MLLSLLLLTLLLLSLPTHALEWHDGPAPHNVPAPLVVRVSPAHVSRWRNARVYGLTRTGTDTFVVSSTTYSKNKDALSKGVVPSNTGVVAWAPLPPESRVSRVSGGANLTDSFVVRFVKWFAKKRGGPARVLQSLKAQCPATRFTEGADADHYVGYGFFSECAPKLARAFPEMLHASPWQTHFTKTTSGASEMLYSSAGSLVNVGAGLTRAVMDLDELDTTHCMFYDSSAPVLYASVGGAAVRLGSTAHRKIAGFVSVCTGQPSSCLSAPASQGNPQDTHATHVTGIAVGQPCGPVQGVAPAARVLFLAIPSAGSPGSLAVPANLGPALQTAVWGNATSLTMSFGGVSDGMYDDMAAQIDAFVISSGAVVTVSAGNSGDSGGLLSSPAVSRNVLSVAAALLPAPTYVGRGYSGALNPAYVASFSSFGALIAAPGVGVLSALADPSAGLNHATFTVMDGTSMASPMVPVQAAQQALGAYGFVNAPAPLVRAFLIAAAVPCTGTVFLDQSSDVCSLLSETPASARCGFGVPHFGTSVLTGTDPSWTFVENQMASSQRFAQCFQVLEADTNATLVWDEPPHVPGWPDPIYHPLGLYVSSSTASAFASDGGVTANHKRVSLSNLAAGSYVRVAVVDPHAESALEHLYQSAPPSPPPTWSKEYEFVGSQPPTPPAASETIPFSLVVRGATPTPSTNCGACSPHEPPVPCYVVNGTGEQACLANGSGFAPCQATSCEPGYTFSLSSSSACVPVGGGSASANCPDPLAWDGSECVCVYAQMQCPDGTYLPCDSSKGLGACAPTSPWVAGENATLLAGAQASLLVGEQSIPDTQFSQSVAVGAGVGAGIVVFLFVVLAWLSAWENPSREWKKWSGALSKDLLTFAFVGALFGVAGCVCAALAEAIAIVWALLLVFIALSVWHVFIARSVAEDESENVCVTRDSRFWAVFWYDAFQMVVGSGTLLGYTAVQFGDGYDTAALLVGLAYAFLGISAIELTESVAIIVLFALDIVLLAAVITSGVTATGSQTTEDWVTFGVLLGLFLCVFGFACILAWRQCRLNASAMGRARKDSEDYEALPSSSAGGTVATAGVGLRVTVARRKGRV
jgi:hypothetical protein